METVQLDTLTQSHVCLLKLYKRDVCVSQLRCCVCVREQMCCCALQMLYLICGGMWWLASPGHGDLALQRARQTHLGTGSARWGGFSKHPQLFNFGRGLGWNYVLVDHIIHVYVISVRRSRLWWNVIAFKARAVGKCLHIHITSFESLSSLKL